MAPDNTPSEHPPPISDGDSILRNVAYACYNSAELARHNEDMLDLFGADTYTESAGVLLVLQGVCTRSNSGNESTRSVSRPHTTLESIARCRFLALGKNFKCSDGDLALDQFLSDILSESAASTLGSDSDSSEDRRFVALGKGSKVRFPELVNAGSTAMFRPDEHRAALFKFTESYHDKQLRQLQWKFIRRTSTDKPATICRDAIASKLGLHLKLTMESTIFCL